MKFSHGFRGKECTRNLYKSSASKHLMPSCIFSDREDAVAIQVNEGKNTFPILKTVAF